MADLNGTYTFLRNENLEQYLEKMDVPVAHRKIMLSSTPTVTISHDGSHWKIEMKSAVRDHTTEFNLGETFEDHMPEGHTFKSKGELDGNSLKISSTETGKGDMERIFTLDGDELVLRLRNPSHNIEAKRFFKKN